MVPSRCSVRLLPLSPSWLRTSMYPYRVSTKKVNLGSVSVGIPCFHVGTGPVLCDMLVCFHRSLRCRSRTATSGPRPCGLVFPIPGPVFHFLLLRESRTRCQCHSLFRGTVTSLFCLHIQSVYVCTAYLTSNGNCIQAISTLLCDLPEPESCWIAKVLWLGTYSTLYSIYLPYAALSQVLPIVDDQMSLSAHSESSSRFWCWPVMARI